MHDAPPTIDFSALGAVLRGNPLPLSAHRASHATLAKTRREEVLRKLYALRMDGLRMYLPLPLADKAHASKAKWTLALGSNRSGKSNYGGAEFAYAVLGCHPHGKYPAVGTALVASLEWDQICLLWAKLTQEGGYKIVRDEHTRLWRAVRPCPADPTRVDDYDEAYREQWKDAPPLIPARRIAAVNWETSQRAPRYVRFDTGWKAHFRSAAMTSRPPQGEHYNLVWFDEHIENPEYFHEAVRGLTGLHESRKHRPRGIWTATAQAATAQLMELRDKARENADLVEVFNFLIEDNPYVPAAERKEFFDSLSPEEQRVRYFGEFRFLERLIYTMYDPNGIHGAEPLQSVPETWTRYVILDPGREHCATVLGGVDPDEQHRTVYDAWDMRAGDAQRWAAELRQRQGPNKFEAMVIDLRAGRQHTMGSGITVASKYFQAAMDAGVEVRLQGPLDGFFPGNDDITAREECLIDWMTPRSNGPFAGTPALRVWKGCCPELDRQVRYAITKSNGKRGDGVPQDLVTALEYWAGSHMTYYHEPEAVVLDEPTPVWDEWQSKKRRKRQIA